MRESYNFVIVCVCIILLLGCNNNVNQEPSLYFLKYDKYEIFVNWSISYREKNVYVFSQHVSDSIINRFIVDYNKDVALIMDTKSASKNYVPYSSFSKQQKEILSEDLILDYKYLGIEGLNYKLDGGNEYLILTKEGKTYWYFFELDISSPPKLMSNYRKIDSLWYQYSHLDSSEINDK